MFVRYAQVKAFRGVTGLRMLESEPLNEGDPIVFSDPLPWWKLHARNFPLLARVARRVLAIPASSAQSERLFSVAGQTVTKKRNSLASDNVELLVFLRTVWPTLDAWVFCKSCLLFDWSGFLASTSEYCFTSCGVCYCGICLSPASLLFFLLNSVFQYSCRFLVLFCFWLLVCVVFFL